MTIGEFLTRAKQCGGVRQYIWKAYPNPTNEYQPLAQQRIQAEKTLGAIETVASYKNISVEEFLAKYPSEAEGLMQDLGLVEGGYQSQTKPV